MLKQHLILQLLPKPLFYCHLIITKPLPLLKPLPKGKNKKVIGLMTDQLARKIMKEFVGLKTKTYKED